MPDLFSDTIPISAVRKQPKDAFRVSKKDLLTVTENAPDVICRFDKSFRLLYVNPAIEMATGIPPSAFKNKTTRELGMPEEHSAHWEKHISRVLTTGQQTTMEFPFLTPIAGLRFFQAVLVPETRKDGTVDTVLTISRDITEKKQQDQKKEEVVSFVGHELKTPVTSLKVSTQMLQRKFAKGGDLRTAQHLARMNRQIDKMTNIISDLMDTTRIEKGSIVLHKEEFDFDELVADTVEEAQNTSLTHTIVVKGKVAKPVVADKLRIGQVITNFLSNAIRYSPEDSEIVVTIEASDSSIRCSVQDFGIGIPAEQQDKIFERFYRVKDGSDSTYLGLGLGLYIASELVKLHGGDIQVESTEGRGSTFSFSLPLLLLKQRDGK